MIIIINQSNIFSSSVSLIARERKMYEINDNQFSVMMYTSITKDHCITAEVNLKLD